MVVINKADLKVLETLFDKVSGSVERIQDKFKDLEIISEYPDQWFLDNLILSLNPTQLVKLLKAADPLDEDPPYQVRDDCIEQALKIWLLMGDKERERRQLFATVISSKMPHQPRRSQARHQGTCYGLTLDKLRDSPADVARISYLAGRIFRCDMHEMNSVRTQLAKQRNQINYAVLVLRVLHYFIDEVGDQCPDEVYRETIFTAISGQEAVYRNFINLDDLNTGKKLRPSRDTLWRAWTRYREQAVILYALTSIEVSESNNLLDELLSEGILSSCLFDNLPQIMARAHYINNHVAEKLSDASDWCIKIPRRERRSKGVVSDKINAHTINLICEFDAEPEGFSAQPFFPDVIDWLSYQLGIKDK